MNAPDPTPPSPTLAAALLARVRALTSWFRIVLARATGAQIATGCSFAAGCDAQLGFASARRGRLALGSRCELAAGVILHPHGGSILLAENIFLGPGTVIYGHGGVEIGKDSLISMHCRILSSDHTVPPPGTIIRSARDKLFPTRIGCDVWLGAGVTVLGGVTIGDGCVVGAGAVVTRDLPANSFAHGVPAVVRAQRT